MISRTTTRIARRILVLLLLASIATGCKKSAVMTLQLYTPTGIDTLEGVTELQIFVDQSTEGLKVPLSVAGQPDAYVDVDPDKQNHVLTIEAYKDATLVSRGRSLSLFFEAKNVATRVVLWPVERFAPLRATLPDDWQGATYHQLQDHRILAVHGTKTMLLDFSTATFLEGPELPGTLETPVGVPLDANRLVLIGQANSYTVDLQKTDVTTTVFDGEAPSSKGGQLLPSTAGSYLLLNPAPASSYVIEAATLKVRKLDIPDETGPAGCAVVHDGFLWLVGVSPSAETIRLVELATGARTVLTDASVTIPSGLAGCQVIVREGGEMLVIGGKTDAPQKTVYLLAPACRDGSCPLQTATGALTAARHRFGASLLRSGQILITGGLTDGDQPLSGSELISLDQGVISSANGGEMIRSRTSHRAFRLDAGEVVLLGGEGRTDGELYMPR